MSILYKFIFVLFILVICGQFVLTPFYDFSRILNFFFSVLGFFYFLIYFKYLEVGFRNLYVYFLLIFIIVIITSILRLNQSFLSSLISNLSIFNVFSTFLLYVYLKRCSNINFFNTLMNVFYCVVSITIVLKFINPSFVFNSYFTGNEILFEAFRLSKGVTNIATFIFFVFFLYSSKFKYFFWFLASLLATHMIDVKRMVLIASLLVFVFSFIKSNNKKLKFNFLFILFFLAILSVPFLLNNTFFNFLLSDLNEAFKLFLFDDNIISDYSTLARFDQINYALERIFQFPIFGNGIPRELEKDVLLGGVYFYIADIGIFGILYGFGIFGLFVFIKQIIYLYQIYITSIHNPMALGLFYYLFFLVVVSFINAYSIIEPSLFFGPLILFYYFRNKYVSI